jgi:hypothetical protein
MRRLAGAIVSGVVDSAGFTGDLKPRVIASISDQSANLEERRTPRRSDVDHQAPQQGRKTTPRAAEDAPSTVTSDAQITCTPARYPQSSVS